MNKLLQKIDIWYLIIWIVFLVLSSLVVVVAAQHYKDMAEKPCEQWLNRPMRAVPLRCVAPYNTTLNNN